jgi:hypothetical protein
MKLITKTTTISTKGGEMKKLGILVLIVFSSFLLTAFTYDFLPNSTATATTPTGSGNLEDVVSTTLAVSDGDKVLVLASIDMYASGDNTAARTIEYQLNCNGTTSGTLQRQVEKVAGAVDHGMGSLSKIFTISGNGTITIKLQHQDLTYTATKYVTSQATISAINLTSNNGVSLNNSNLEISSDIGTTNPNFEEVTGLKTSAINMPLNSGSFYISASIGTSASGTEAGLVGQWQLEYSTDDANWNLVGNPISRSLSSKADNGMASLVGLVSGLNTGDYYFRVAHRRSSGSSKTVNTTSGSNINVVALNYVNGEDNGFYPAFSVESSTGDQNSTTSFETVVSKSFISMYDISEEEPDVLLHAQFNMSGTAAMQTDYVLDVTDDGVFSWTSTQQSRYLSDSSDTGSGVQIGIASNLDPIKANSASLKHKINTGTGSTLTSNNVVLVGFQLFSDDQTDPVLPVTLSHFSAAFIGTTPVIAWTTQSESGNAGWNVYRGTTQDALQNSEVTLLNSGLINGAGTTSEPTNYTFSDEYAYNTNATYYYWLESVSISGVSENHGSVQLYIPQSNPGSPAIPEEFGLYQNYPNPFNPTTTISFSVPSATRATVTIYNAKGGKVAEIFNGAVPAKEVQSILWDGTDSFGKPVTSGIYLYKMQTEKETLTKRMMLLK